MESVNETLYWAHPQTPGRITTCERNHAGQQVACGDCSVRAAPGRSEWRSLSRRISLSFGMAELRRQKICAEQVADAHALGLSDADIEAIRQSIVAAVPQDLAGDVVVRRSLPCASGELICRPIGPWMSHWPKFRLPQVNRQLSR